MLGSLQQGREGQSAANLSAQTSLKFVEQLRASGHDAAGWGPAGSPTRGRQACATGATGMHTCTLLVNAMSKRLTTAPPAQTEAGGGCLAPNDRLWRLLCWVRRRCGVAEAIAAGAVPPGWLRGTGVTLSIRLHPGTAVLLAGARRGCTPGTGPTEAWLNG